MRRALVVLGVIGALGVPAVASSQRAAQATGGVTVSVGGVTVVEGDTGTSVISVPLDLSAPLTTAVKVPWRFETTGDGSADPADAILKSGTMSFPAGAVAKVLKLTIVGDGIKEPDQHLQVRLGVPTAPVTVEQGIGAITVIDNDADGVAPGVEVNVGDVEVEEADAGTHFVYLPITLSRPATTNLVIQLRAGCKGTGTYDVTNPTNVTKITFAAGQQTKTVKFAITADTKGEDLESYAQAIKAAIGPMAIVRDTGDITIVDDDGNPIAPPMAVGEKEQISVDSHENVAMYAIPLAGTGTRASYGASITADGRFVVFVSDACNLVDDDTNGIGDVFVRDRALGTTERVDLNADGTQIDRAQGGNTGAPYSAVRFRPSISDDGRYVVFTTPAGLVPADTNNVPYRSWIEVQDVYRYDRTTHTTSLVTVAPDGSAAGGIIDQPSISGDGRYVSFRSQSPALGATTSQFTFVRDLVTGTNTIVPGDVQTQELSRDGRHLLMTMGNPARPSSVQVVMRDLATATNERVDVANDGTGAETINWASQAASPSMSPDGRYVLFRSDAWNLVPGETAPPTGYSGAFPLDLVHLYVRDLQNDTTTIVGDGTPSDEWYTDGVYPTSISANGQRIVKASQYGFGLAIDVPTGTEWHFGFGQTTGSDSTWITGPRSLTSDGDYVVFEGEQWPYGDLFIERIG